MKAKVFSERLTLEITKDRLGEPTSIIEIKHFDTDWESVVYCSGRMEDIKIQEWMKAAEIGEDTLANHIGIPSVAIPKKDGLYEHFATMRGCKNWYYTFSIIREIYMGVLGWEALALVRIPEDPKERKKVARGLEEK